MKMKKIIIIDSLHDFREKEKVMWINPLHIESMHLTSSAHKGRGVFSMYGIGEDVIYTLTHPVEMDEED